MLIEVNFPAVLLADIVGIAIVLAISLLGKQLRNEPYRWVVVNIMLADLVIILFFANCDPWSPIRKYMGGDGTTNLEFNYQSVNVYTRIMRWMHSYFPMALIFLVNDSIWTFVFPSLRQNRRFMMANSIVIIAIINFQPAALFLVEVMTSGGYHTNTKEAAMKLEPLGLYQLATFFVSQFFLFILIVFIIQTIIFATIYTICCTRRDRPCIKKRIWYFIDMLLLLPLSCIVLLVQGPQLAWTGTTVAMKLMPRLMRMMDPDDIPSMTPDQLQMIVTLVHELADAQSAFIALTPLFHCACFLLFSRAYLSQLIAIISCGQLIFKHRIGQLDTVKRQWAERIDKVIPISRNSNKILQSPPETPQSTSGGLLSPHNSKNCLPPLEASSLPSTDVDPNRPGESPKTVLHPQLF